MKIRCLDGEEGEDNDLFNAYRFHPAFALEVKGANGQTADVIFHFCTNDEGSNDMGAEEFQKLLVEKLTD